MHHPRRFDCSITGYSNIAAQKALYTDGVIILSHVDQAIEGDWSKVPTLVWDQDSLLLPKHRADAVHTEHEALDLQGMALPPHSDGYMWGDCFPDIVILVCEEPADGHGGSNYLIDGYQIREKLQDDTKRILENELVDHTERGDSSVTVGAESFNSVFRHLGPKGWRRRFQKSNHRATRLCWRRMLTKDASDSRQKANEDGLELPYTSLWAPMPGLSADQAETVALALRELDRTVVEQEARASRFQLQKGEALIIDNYRMLHARDSFQGSENKRRMFRIWSWTNESFGLPPSIKSSGAGVPATILEKKDEKIPEINAGV